AMRPPHYKAAGGIDVVFGLRIYHIAGDDGVDDVLLYFAPEFIGSDIGAVLGGNDDGVNAGGPVADIFNADLALAIGTQEIQDALAARVREAAHQLVRHHNGKRHQLGGFIASIAKHEALVTGATGI